MPKKKSKKKFKQAKERTTSSRHKKTPLPIVRARQQQILKMYSQGIPLDVIAKQLDMPGKIVTRNLNLAIDRMIQMFAQATPQHTFVKYATFQMDIIRKLQRTYERHTKDKKATQYNAAIQALRTMSDIYDKILLKGTDFGVIEQKRADRKSLHGKAEDIKGELVTEIVQLQKLVETIDDSQAKAMLADRNPAVHTTIRYTRIIRKPLRDEYGIKRASPDWKYRTKIYEKTSDGKYIRRYEHTLSPEEQDLLPEKDPDYRIHKALADEQNKILVQTTDGHTFYVDKENLSNPPESNKEDTKEQGEEEGTSKVPENTSTWLVPPKRL